MPMHTLSFKLFSHYSFLIPEVYMSQKKSTVKLDIKKLFSAIMCLLIALMFFASQLTHGFSIPRLVFGAISLYFSIAFFRMSGK